MPGAVAAPTAGLHFTEEMLRKLPHTFVTLHVGPGTFLPVKSDKIDNHQMHAEAFSISESAAKAISSAQRIVAVGTTSVRVLESVQRENGRLGAQTGRTDLFVYPPYRFSHVDLLLTNFHLPRSTLLMLVSAFAGREFLLEAYAEAIRERYRFYSYGDCMLIIRAWRPRRLRGNFPAVDDSADNQPAYSATDQNRRILMRDDCVRETEQQSE